MVSITELIHIICLRRTFFCCCCCCFVIVSVDLGTFGGMQNEGKKMACIVESGFDDMDDVCGMSVVETGGVRGHNNTR